MANKQILFITSFLLIHNCLSSQIRVSGSVREYGSQESLIGASIFNKTNANCVASNQQGFYMLICDIGDTLNFSYIGYKHKQVIITQEQDVYNVALERGYELKSLQIRANKLHRADHIKISPQTLAEVASLLAKPDITKTLQLLPGILSQNEGSASIMVRGGDPGQNLYLLDGVPLIYIHHLGGFMSVFNPDMINDVSVYKGSFPARYGGKLSSIIDITQREGNISERKGNVSVGLTDMSFSVEGPYKNRDDISYIVTGRKTLIDPLVWTATTLSDGGTYRVFFGFHDFNGKVSWKKDKRNTFNLNAYYGDDYFRFKSNNNGKGKYLDIWGNILFSAKWNHLLQNSMSVSNTMSFNSYRVKKEQVSKIEDVKEYNKYKSTVKNTMLRSHWNYQLSNRWYTNYGLQSNWWYNRPNKYRSTQNDTYTEKGVNSLETALYVDQNIQLTDFLGLDVGLRYLNYLATDYCFNALEPRVSMQVMIGNSQSLHFGYMQINQSSHLMMTSATEVMQSEIWLGASKNEPMSFSDQLSVAWKASFFDNCLSMEISAYSKTMEHLVTYKEGYSFMAGDNHWRDKIEINGKGKSQGVELFLKKGKGRFRGFSSYTYSHTTRTFKNINEGKQYLFEYDRPHAFSINVGYDIRPKLTLNALWVYQTGLPYTPAIGKQYMIDNNSSNSYLYEGLIYGERNSDRLSDYHHLDLSLKYEKKSEHGNLVEWTFSIYNVYMRQNAHHYYYNNNSSGEISYSELGVSTENLCLYQMSYMPFVPTVSYKVFFDETHFLRKKKREKNLSDTPL